MDYTTLNADQFAAMNVDDFAGLPLEDSSSSSSESSESSASSASSESSSSLSSFSSVSSASSDSTSSSSSEPEEEPLRYLHADQSRNSVPMIFINDDDPGLITKVDEIAYRYAITPTLRGPVTIEIETPYANSEIRYTLNGKSPTPHSNLYVGPVVFRQNATGEKTALRARVYDKRNANVKSRIIRLDFRIISTR